MPATRVIDAKYHIEVRDGAPVIVKTATGKLIPEDEPLILFRGQDRLVPALLARYADLCVGAGSPPEQLDLIAETSAKFRQFATKWPTRVKVPD